MRHDGDGITVTTSVHHLASCDIEDIVNFQKCYLLHDTVVWPTVDTLGHRRFVIDILKHVSKNNLRNRRICPDSKSLEFFSSNLCSNLTSKTSKYELGMIRTKISVLISIFFLTIYEGLIVPSSNTASRACFGNFEVSWHRSQGAVFISHTNWTWQRWYFRNL